MFLVYIFSVQAHRTSALEEVAEQNNGPDGEAVVPNRVSIWPFLSKHVVVLATEIMLATSSYSH